jgi:3-carboxy-cis,cis-muconate cycloisomerase
MASTVIDSILFRDAFGTERMREVFSDRALIARYIEVEVALARAEARCGVIPAEAAEVIERESKLERIDFDHMRHETDIVGYPILPLVHQMVEMCGEAGRYVHWGATTQDIMDTGLALLGGRAFARIEALTQGLGDELAAMAETHRATVMAGRTHAQPAVPITFGGKLAVWLAELTRHLERLRAARARFAVVQLFGAAGTAAALGPRSRSVRHGLAERLGLGMVDVPWHAARDSVAEAGSVLAAAAGTCGKLAKEVIELSRPELGELREAGGHPRGASSTMPQKANPIGSEAVVGLSILAAHQSGAVLAALQGTHERSAGEWQAEWDALPLLFASTAGALAGTRRLMEGLQVFPGRMRENIAADNGLIMAEAAMIALAGVVGRAAAHEVVVESSSVARAERISLREALERALDTEKLAALPPLGDVLDAGSYLGESDSIVTAAVEAWGEVRTGSSPPAGTARP